MRESEGEKDSVVNRNFEKEMEKKINRKRGENGEGREKIRYSIFVSEKIREIER